MTHESYSDEAPLNPTSSSEQALTKGGTAAPPPPPPRAKKIGIILEKITSRGQVGMHGEAKSEVIVALWCGEKKFPRSKRP